MPRSYTQYARSIGEFLALRAAENKKSDTPFLDACLIAAFCMGINRDRLLASGFPTRFGGHDSTKFRACLEAAALRRKRGIHNRQKRILRP